MEGIKRKRSKHTDAPKNTVINVPVTKQLDQNGPKGKPHENEFGLFSNSDMNVTNRVEKVDEKNCHLSSFHVPFLSYGPKIV